jgi:outer membrane lipoprotein-sorting protein
MSLNLLGRISLIFFILLSNNAHSDDRAELLKLENYLNSLQHIVAKFVQVDANGNTQRGNFFLSRPGKLKWDYVEPKRISILFKSNKIFYHDKGLDQRSEYKTQDSLLYFLIAPKISFLSPDSQYYLQSFSNTGKEIALEVKKHNQTKGEVLVLRFSTAPVSLTSVEVKGSLRIFIDSVIEYPTLDQNLFNS